MKNFLVLVLIIPFLGFTQVNDQNLQWIGKPNRIINPGAESNSAGAPINWKSNFELGAESNWVSEYGVTSHEWNHGSKKLGLPINPGNNYFRLTVSKYDDNRKINLYQNVNLDDLQSSLKLDSIFVNFQFWVGSNYNSPNNCSYTEIKVLFKDNFGKLLDSIYLKKLPKEFKDLDANTPESEERGFNVMHEMKLFTLTSIVPKESRVATINVHCEYPCDKFTNEEEEETESEKSNTFFFDNFQLGFYKK